MNFRQFLTYLACSLITLLSACSESRQSYDREEAVRRVLEVQRLQNLNPGDPTVVPRIVSIIDSMAGSGKDACYFGAVNVLIDRLFSDGRYAEADSLAVRMQQDADEMADSLSMAMAKRVRAQILYKLSQSDRAMREALSALPYITDPLRSGSHFGTATSLDEWIHIIAMANGDTAIMKQAGSRYAETVDRNIKENSWSDSTGHYPVTALAFKAQTAILDRDASKAGIFLDSAAKFIRKDLPPRAYEHFYDVRCRYRAARNDYSGALADVDTLLSTHRCFPWFYIRDLQLKADVQNQAGLHEQSAQTYSKYISYHDSLSSRLTDRRLHDLTVLFRSELDMKERRANTIRLISLGSVTVMLLILFSVTLRHAMKERKRNRLLVERLHEYDRAEQTLIDKIPECSSNTEEIPQIARLDRHMVADRPYTDPSLGRKELADFLGVPQDAVAQMIRAEYNQTVHAYINSFRTEEVRRILDSDSSETIAEIAVKLGFGTARTLQRAFKERFDMTPTQYKEAVSSLRNTQSQ